MTFYQALLRNPEKKREIFDKFTNGTSIPELAQSYNVYLSMMKRVLWLIHLEKDLPVPKDVKERLAKTASKGIKKTLDSLKKEERIDYDPDYAPYLSFYRYTQRLSVFDDWYDGVKISKLAKMYKTSVTIIKQVLFRTHCEKDILPVPISIRNGLDESFIKETERTAVEMHQEDKIPYVALKMMRELRKKMYRKFESNPSDIDLFVDKYEVLDMKTLLMGLALTSFENGKNEEELHTVLKTGLSNEDLAEIKRDAERSSSKKKSSSSDSSYSSSEESSSSYVSDVSSSSSEDDRLTYKELKKDSKLRRKMYREFKSDITRIKIFVKKYNIINYKTALMALILTYFENKKDLPDILKRKLDCADLRRTKGDAEKLLKKKASTSSSDSSISSSSSTEEEVQPSSLDEKLSSLIAEEEVEKVKLKEKEIEGKTSVIQPPRDEKREVFDHLISSGATLEEICEIMEYQLKPIDRALYDLAVRSNNFALNKLYISLNKKSSSVMSEPIPICTICQCDAADVSLDCCKQRTCQKCFSKMKGCPFCRRKIEK